MSPKILYILVVALGFNASSDAASAARRREEPRPVAQNPLDPARAYTERRWIGLRRKGVDHCPDVTGWTATPLLSERPVIEEKGRKNDKYLAVKTKKVNFKLHKLKLDQFCIYTPKEGGPLVEFLPPSGLKEVQMDRLALSTTSAGGLPLDDLGQMTWKALASHFRDQTGQILNDPNGNPEVLLFTGTPGVRLTFIDSQPDGEEVPSKAPLGSLHGFTLAHFAQDLVCPLPDHCAAKIATRRALRFQDFDASQPLPPAEDESGHVGLVSHLAAAIVAEVLHWQQVDSDKKLILNLSLGWDGELFGDLDKRKVSQLEPSVQAVYKAIRFARHSGALVIAAAGNQRGGAQESAWPLLPAAWELRRPTWLPCPLGRKTVYAVGGVDGQGLPLVNSRQGGYPRRVAYSDHSVTAVDAAGGPTAIYTGTSVSAAVASSIAAVIWHLRPDLSPAQVMRLMKRSGDRLPAPADFYAWKNAWLLSQLVKAPDSRRLSLCQAVTRACRNDGSLCPALTSLPTCPQWIGKAPKLAALLKDVGKQENLATSFIPQENHELVTSQRWVLPQPEDVPCPSCTLVPKPPPGGTTLMTPVPTDYKLVLQIKSTWQDLNTQKVKITGGTLKIERLEDGVVVETIPYPLQSTGMEPPDGVIREILGVVTGQSLIGWRAKIIFDVEKTDGTPASIVNPVTIDPLPPPVEPTEEG